FGVDVAALRPVGAVADVAPHPLLLIQGDEDTLNPPASLAKLSHAAQEGWDAHVTALDVPGAAPPHGVFPEGDAYVSLVTSFLSGASAHDMDHREPSTECLAGEQEGHPCQPPQG